MEGPVLDPTTRAPGSPLVGLVRQGVRLALGSLAAILAGYIGEEDAQQLVGQIEVAVFAAVTLGLAYAGKWLRDRGIAIGELF